MPISSTFEDALNDCKQLMVLPPKLHVALVSYLAVGLEKLDVEAKSPLSTVLFHQKDVVLIMDSMEVPKGRGEVIILEIK
jgi:hypothetical protein